MTETSDILVIGAGIAGASAAFFLSETGAATLVEREGQPGYHATGRSAAMHTETYGNRTIRALTVASRPFFERPPEGFSAEPLSSPRGVLFIGRADQAEALDKVYAESARLVPGVRRTSREEALALCPALKPDYVAGAIFEPDARDLDVDTIHQGYLKGAKRRGAKLVTDAEVTALRRANGAWLASTGAGDFRAEIVVLAAGAWSDAVAALAGASPMGLSPRRRTAFLFPAPEGMDAASWPLVEDAEEAFYFKPQSGLLMGSPADETPCAPCDAQAEELDVAIGADRIEQATSIPIRRIARRWAGLRTFAPDRTPVVGFDPEASGLFWLAGQGGYGIMTSPAMGRLAAALIAGRPLPDDLARLGLAPGALAPDRFRP